MLSNPPFALKDQAERLIIRLKGLVKQVERQWGLRACTLPWRALTQGCLRPCRTIFTPLESPGIYAGDVINRKHQLLVKVGSKPHLSNGVYYLVRETLLNAASVGVELRVEDHEIRITVADNRRGFSFRGHYDHSTLMERKLGPVTLKGRIKSLGGTLAIDSSEAGDFAPLLWSLKCRSRWS